VKTLAIETATSVCAAAVVDSGVVLSEASLDEKNIHAEKLITQIDTVLSSIGCSPADLDGIAVSIGPGSFTGLRIGLSVAKGIAFAAGKPVAAVPTLQALAQRAVDEAVVPEGAYLLAALDARRDEVYGEWFVPEGGVVRSTGPEKDMTLAQLFSVVPDGLVFVTGDARGKIRETLALLKGERSRPWSFVPDRCAACSAATVGRLGEKMLLDGQTSDPVTLEPRYIKEFFFRQMS
jgi:tRNA threonylcarbamoyladenosine biosynthesis protein TsaB